MKRLLPDEGTPAMAAEIELFRSSTRQQKFDRAKVLGFSSAGSYFNSMYLNGAGVVPNSTRTKYNNAPVIKESCIAIFDSQIPYHDGEFLTKLMELSRVWGIQQGISGGDFLNMTAFSRFGQKPEEKVWAKERDVAKDVITALCTSVPNWLLLMGNHEAQMIKQVAEQFDYEDILALLRADGGLVGTDYFWCEVKLGGSKWRISHPRNISVIHGRIPQRLCDKFHCNVASGHGHLSGLTPDYSNKYVACDVGITCDPQRLDYYSLRDSTRPAMCQGAIILKLGEDGKCHHYHIDPRNVDWEALKKCYGSKS